ncbi:MAG: hypothetical protein ACLFVR_15870 [Thiohalospira sp.]
MLIKKQTTAFHEIKNYLQTGDIILMHGLHLSSRFIESLEGSPWSHVAMIVLAQDIGIDAGKDTILLWESDTESPVQDVILNKAKSGPMLVKLSERLKYNFTHKEDNQLSIRHLYTERTQKMFDGFKKIIPEVHQATFPDVYHEMINPTKGRIFHEKTSLDTFFCSELAAYTYKNMGLLTSIHPVNSYIPMDFSDKLSVGLLNRAWLGNEINIEINLNKL